MRCWFCALLFQYKLLAGFGSSLSATLAAAVVFHHLDDRSKGKGLVGRQLRQDFAIQLEFRLVVASHEMGVPPVVLPHSGLDALDPQLGPLPSFAASVPVGILPRLLEASNGDPKAVLAPSAKALGVFQEILFLVCRKRAREKL